MFLFFFWCKGMKKWGVIKITFDVSPYVFRRLPAEQLIRFDECEINASPILN